MTTIIAFHSYKGGTGKTTIAANLAAILTRKGYRVSLLDLDVYAPSLCTYFRIEPEKWINDYLWKVAEVDEIMVDLTPTIINLSNNSRTGRLNAAFCDPKREDILKLEGFSGNAGSNRINPSIIQMLRRFILLREQLISKYSPDYIILDTSPGIRYWSINALAVVDILFLTLAMDNLDVAGTKDLAKNIYESFSKFGAKTYLLLNRIAGYCTPPATAETIGWSLPQSAYSNSVSSDSQDIVIKQKNDSAIAKVAEEAGMEVICSIPCYCDIQFNRREFLTVLNCPDHPYSVRMEILSEDYRLKSK